MQRYLVPALCAVLLACGGDAPGSGSSDTTTAIEPTDERGAIVFLGTSLTAGLGVDPVEAYPALIQAKLDSAGLPYRTQNAGISGETSAGALERLDWVLQQPMDMMVVETGANDGLRGLPVEALAANLDSILTRVHRHDSTIELVVVGMEAPPNMGARYADAFRAVYADAAAKHDAALVPFLLEEVGGVDSLNTADGIHPNARGHRIIAETVWGVLEDEVRSEK
ncbi:MAG TPA: arylesterase [Gemmatimonadales bacterium]|nr:arylesterase [Gemmatimonadales bacterium]